MFKFIFITIISIISLSNLNAEIVKKVEINGNNRISDETIKVYGNIKINKDYSELDLNNLIKDLYSTDFFENIELNLKNNTLIILVKEYPIINQLIIIGEKKKAFKEEVKKLIKLKEKKSFIKSSLLSDVETIKKIYSSFGYNSAEVETKINVIDEKSVDLLLEIKRGEKTKISSIKFIGNEFVKAKRLRDIISSEEKKFWKFLSRNTNFSENLMNLDKRLITNYYKSIGFYNIKVNSNVARINELGGVDVIYSVEEGQRYTINKISTSVDDVFDKKIFFELNKLYSNYVGQYYSPFKVKKLLDEIDIIIDKNNLQFVEHNVQEEIKDDSINITFNIFEGEKDLIDRINIKGNNTTNESVIRGELIVDEGDPLTNINLEKSIAKIKSRGIFKKVDYEVYDSEQSNLKNIDIIVEEQPTGEISAGAGIGTSGGTLAFGIKENNWMGEGKSLALDIQLDQESLAGYVNFTNPNYDFLGNSISYSVSTQSNDKPNQGYENKIISAGIGTSFEQYRNLRLSLGLDASYDDLRTDSKASQSLKKHEGTFSEVAGSYGLSYDLRDRAFAPTNGYITTFNQKLPIAADEMYITNTFSTSHYKPINENVIGAAKLYLSSINGIGDDDARLSKRRFLSEKRLRGFERGKVGPVDSTDHVGGNYTTALNLETNLPNFFPDNYNADAIFFLDFANVWGVDYSDSIDDSNELRSSTGVGVNWLSPIGPISFNFAQNLSKAETDKTQSFSFNLGTTF